MSLRVAAALLLVCAVAVGQDADGTKIIRAESYWLLDGQTVGLTGTWEGGDWRTSLGAGQQPTAPRLENVRVTVPPALPPLLKDWVVATLAATGASALPEREVTLLEMGRIGGVRQTTVYQKSRIREIRFPAFDGQETLGLVGITFAPEGLQTPAQAPAFAPPAAAGTTSEQIKAVHFRLTIPGVACEHVSTLGAITARPGEGGSRFAASSIVLTVVDKAGDTTWRDWFDSFVVQKNNGPGNEKAASLEIYYLRTGNPIALTVSLGGVGILRRTPIRTGSYVHHEVELYCRSVSLGAAGGAPPKGPVGPGDSILTPRKTPFAAAGEDKGAKDIEGIPRFPESVRTGYTSNRSKVQSDETAEYSTAQSVEKVEAFYAEKMKELGWTSNSRQESGAVADGTYKVELRWDREKNTARLAIGRPKGGGTTLYWHLLTKLQ
jgi:hypothetical protein